MRLDAEQPEPFQSPVFRGSIGIAMAITDPQGRFLECNPAWSALLGYPEADLQGLDLTTLVHPDERLGLGELLEQLHRHEEPKAILEKRLFTQTGQTIWCRTHIALADTHGQVTDRLLLVATDITHQRLAEQQQQKNQRLLRMAGRVASLSSWSFDATTQTLYWSDECCELHGHPALYKPTVEEGIAHYAPEYREMIARAVDRCLGQGEPFDFDAELVRKDGRRVWVRAMGESIRDARGTITGFEGAVQDISAQRQHEQERHAAASKLSTALERMPDAFFTLDRNWIITFANREMSRVVGRPLADMVGKRMWDVFPEAENSSFHTCFRNAMDAGALATLVDYYPPLGQWFEVRSHPTDDGVAVHFQDVTQKRLDDAQLQLLQTCMRRMNDIIVITEAEPISGDGPKVLYVNDAFERNTGYRADEIIGKTPRLLQGPKTQRDVLDRIRSKLTAWQPVREELINYTKQGEEFWLELDIMPVADASGWYTQWISIERNVTERKQAEEALKEQAALLDKAQDSIWVIDIQSRITYWNLSSERMHGLTAAEALDADIRTVLHDDHAAFNQRLHTVMETGEWVGEVEYKNCEGKKLTLVSRLTLVRDEAQQPRSILAINTDVTEQKLLEQQFLRAQRMESIGTLASGIAHDLNNVLAPILMSISMLKEDLQDPESLALLRTIEVSAQRGANLIRQVLSFGRGVEGKRNQVRVADALKELELILNETVPRNIAIQCTVEDGLWPVQGDPTQIQQVLLNLCVNARDAMPAGGRIQVSAENMTLDAHYAAMNIEARVGPYVKIEVEDNGSGIEAAILDRIFDPFFTTKPVGQGTGLGLATTQAIVKSHGGFIRVYSEPGKGTCFRIYLPADMSAATTDAPGVPTSVPRGNGQLILLVDDEEAIRDVTRYALEAHGYRTLMAADGAEAVALFAQHIDQVDLVLTDMMMPVMDGPATILVLRKIRPNIRIIGTSGISDNGKLVHALGAGLQYFLPKPYTADVLLRTLAEALA